MAFNLTESAAAQIKAQLARRGHGVALRVGVKKIGCSGYGYQFAYADAVAAGDSVFEVNDAKVVVDDASLAFLDGSTLDFVKEGFKQVFKVDNPNVDATCGCGESFSVKDSKTPAEAQKQS